MASELSGSKESVFFGRKITHKKPVLGWVLISLGVALSSALIAASTMNRASGYEIGQTMGLLSSPCVISVIMGFGYLKDRQPPGGLKLKQSTLEISKVGIPFVEIHYSDLHSARLLRKGRSDLIELMPLNLESFLERIPKNASNILKARMKSGFPGMPLFSYQMEDPLDTICFEINRRIMGARTEAMGDSSLLPSQ